MVLGAMEGLECDIHESATDGGSSVAAGIFAPSWGPSIINSTPATPLMSSAMSTVGVGFRGSMVSRGYGP